MNHYKQIILNLNLKDNVPHEQMEALADKIQDYTEMEIKEMNLEVEDIMTRVN